MDSWRSLRATTKINDRYRKSCNKLFARIEQATKAAFTYVEDKWTMETLNGQRNGFFSMEKLNSI